MDGRNSINILLVYTVTDNFYVHLICAIFECSNCRYKEDIILTFKKYILVYHLYNTEHVTWLVNNLQMVKAVNVKPLKLLILK